MSEHDGCIRMIQKLGCMYICIRYRLQETEQQQEVLRGQEFTSVSSRRAHTKENVLSTYALVCALVCMWKVSEDSQELTFYILSACSNVEAKGVVFPLASSAASTCLRAVTLTPPSSICWSRSFASQQQAKFWSQMLWAGDRVNRSVAGWPKSHI